MRPALVFLLLLLAMPARAAEEPKAVATASKTEVSVGETFTVDVRVTGPAGAEFVFPPEAVQETFELRAAPPESAAVAPGTHRYRAAVFALGDAEVPAIPIRYRLPDGTTGEIQTAAIPLQVVSLLPKAEDEQKLADVRGPVDLGVGRLFWIGLAAVLLLLAGVAWWIVSRRRRKAPEVVVPAPVVEPDEEARRALEALVASGRLARGEYRLFYIDLTAIAKRYLERRLGAPIVEMTTAELLYYLRAHPHGVDLAPTLRDLTGAADQIKFARGSGMNEEAERHLAATQALVHALEARLRATPTPEKGEAA